jgi:hypothetical protein
MKWEYLVLKVKPGMLESDDPLEMSPRGGSVGFDNLNTAMNKLGEDGWEGYNTMFDGKGVVTQVLLKRQKS